MRTTAVMLLLACLCAGSARAAGPTPVFETIALTNLKAGEIAALLAPHFRYAGALGAPAPAQRPSAQADVVPEGTQLITASHQSSRYLLVAGTPEAVGQLRGLLALLDVRPRPVRLTVHVYPAAADRGPSWQDIPETPGVEAAVRGLAPGELPRCPALPRGFEPHEIVVEALHPAPEFIPLPLFADWPQALLCAAAHINADGGITLAVGAGLLEPGGDPRAAVEQAWSMPAARTLRPGEALALALSRGDAGITVVIAPSAPGLR